MNVAGLSDLAARWRDDADRFRRLGQEAPAAMAKAYANELEERLRAWQLEALTLEEAAEESGFAYSTLQQKVSAGEIPNAGERGRPRVRRRDLPRRSPVRTGGGPDLAHEALTARLAR